MEPIKIMRTIIMRTTEKQIIGNQYDIEKNATTNSVSENSSKSEKNVTKSNNNLTKRALIIERKIVSVAEVITMISKTEAWRKKETLTSTKK